LRWLLIFHGTCIIINCDRTIPNRRISKASRWQHLACWRRGQAWLVTPRSAERVRGRRQSAANLTMTTTSAFYAKHLKGDPSLTWSNGRFFLGFSNFPPRYMYAKASRKPNLSDKEATHQILNLRIFAGLLKCHPSIDGSLGENLLLPYVSCFFDPPFMHNLDMSS